MGGIVLLFGAAGSGKDSAAEFLCESGDTVAIALADPMKRLCHQLFRFSYEQLWGPSENRNRPDERYSPDSLKWDEVKCSVDQKTLPKHSMVRRWVFGVLVGGVTSRPSESDIARFIDLLSGWVVFLQDKCKQENKALTPRMALQTLGTEVGRSFYEDIWINYACNAAEDVLVYRKRYDRAKGTFWSDFSDKPNFRYKRVVITDGRFINELNKIKSLGHEAWRIKRPGAEVVDLNGVLNHQSETEQLKILDSNFNRVIINDSSLEEFKKKVLQNEYQTRDSARSAGPYNSPQSL